MHIVLGVLGSLISVLYLLDRLGSAAHLLGAPQVIDTQLNGLADKNKERFPAPKSDGPWAQ